MADFLIGCLIGAAAAACIAMPCLLPWHLRVRYLVSVPAVDPRLGVGPLPQHEMREVRVATIGISAGRLELEVEEAGPGEHGRRMLLRRDECAPAVVAQLDGWSTLRMPLLLIVDDLRRAHVYGPDGAVTGLTPARLTSREHT